MQLDAVSPRRKLPAKLARTVGRWVEGPMDRRSQKLGLYPHPCPCAAPKCRLPSAKFATTSAGSKVRLANALFFASDRFDFAMGLTTSLRRIRRVCVLLADITSTFDANFTGYPAGGLLTRRKQCLATGIRLSISDHCREDGWWADWRTPEPRDRYLLRWLLRSVVAGPAHSEPRGSPYRLSPTGHASQARSHNQPVRPRSG